MIRCNHCGTNNLDGSEYCDECGTKLTADAPAPRQQPYSPPPPLIVPVSPPPPPTFTTNTKDSVPPIPATPYAPPTRQSPLTPPPDEVTGGSFDRAGERVPNKPSEAVPRPPVPSQPPANLPAPPKFAEAELNKAPGGGQPPNQTIAINGLTNALRGVSDADVGRHQTEKPRQPITAKLIIQRGGTIGKEFFVSGTEALIGRWDADGGVFPDIDLDQDDPEAKVSRRHARIQVSNNQFLIEDLGSTNGTFVNRGPRLAQGAKQTLKNGDEIIVGKTFLKFVLI